MSELREIIAGKISVYKGITHQIKDIDGLIKDVEAWHKSERKNWALGLLGKESEKLSHEDEFESGIRVGHNNCREEIIKKIEEGDKYDR